MAASTRTFGDVKEIVLSCHSDCSPEEKAVLYNNWARTYEQDVALLEFRAPSLAADILSSHFTGDREAAMVLDVACGTGMMAKQMKERGFARFVGIDASTGMMELARETGLYQDLSQCMLGKVSLPVKLGQFDVVVAIGSLSLGQVPVCVVRELCRAAKPGGYICMTTRSNQSNLEYKADLDSELRRMEDEGLWEHVQVTEVANWERGVTAQEEGYISGCVYLYRSLPPV